MGYLSRLYIGRRMHLLILPLLLFLSLGVSCSSEPASLEKQAQNIDKLLMCPVCPAETIDQSQAELAVQMRGVVRQKLQAGESKEEILAFFVDKYEKSVLAEPPKDGFNLVVWLVPPIALAVGLGLFWIAVRQMGQKHWLRPGINVQPEELAPYLEEVEAEFLAFEGAHVAQGKRR